MAQSALGANSQLPLAAAFTGRRRRRRVWPVNRAAPAVYRDLLNDVPQQIDDPAVADAHGLPGADR